METQDKRQSESKKSRMFKLLVALGNEEVLSKEAWADRFGVSEREIRRDIAQLDALGYKFVRKSTASGAQKIDYKNIKLENPTDFSGLGLSIEDKEQIATLVGSYKQSGFDSLTEMWKEIAKVIAENDNNWLSIDFTDWYGNNRLNKSFTTIKKALKAQNKLQFNYRSWGGHSIAREVEPERLVFKSDAWYLTAYCLKRERFVNFKLNRISGLLIHQERFKKRKESLPMDLFTMDSTPKEEDLTTFKLKISDKIGVKVFDYFHDLSKGCQLKVVDGYYNIEINRRYRSEDEKAIFNELLMSFGEHLEVIAPTEAREMIREKHRKALAIYE